MGVIYVITNTVNGKKYAGKTLGTAKHRWGQHKAASRKGGQYFYRAIRKYGAENFTIEVVDSADTHEELLAKEMEWIKRLNTCDRRFGYNGTLGGESGVPTPETLAKMRGRPCSPETRRKIGEAQKGKIVPRDVVERIAAARRGKGWKPSPEHRAQINSVWKGGKHREESKRKIGESNRRLWTPEKRTAMSERRKRYCAANPLPAPLLTLEGRARVTSAVRERWASMTPEERSAAMAARYTKAREVLKDPALIKRRNAAIKAAWTPEKRAVWAEKMRPRLVAQAVRANAAAVEARRLRKEANPGPDRSFAGVVAIVKGRRAKLRSLGKPTAVVRMLEAA